MESPVISVQNLAENGSTAIFKKDTVGICNNDWVIETEEYGHNL
jgi:hypothetical protein